MKLNKTIILTILTLAGFIQLIIISYNYLTDYIIITGIVNFITRLLIGTSFSFVFALLLVFLDIQLINKLDKIFILPEKLLPRIPSELILTVIIGALIGATVTVIAGAIMPYQDGLIKNIITNSIITSVINIIMISVIEAISWFKRNQETLLIAEKLEKENSQIRFETLKSQLNPHFLFNSLNVLSSLIKKDSGKAQNFVDEFSSVYRYTLDVIEKTVVELREEIDFAKSFLFLQKIRFDNAVDIQINVDASKLNYLVPPLAIQTLLENAFKHNKASVEQPLKIKIYNEDNFLFIVNNLQLKIKGSDSKGVGLTNLKKRYELLGEELSEFFVTETEYVAKIPLIKPE
ncbi:MAG: histidine kinase [Ignavibacteriaceae bacterium]|nr:histidine kinase [Ignavibacterium sp.]MCC6256294.1 histidine kinase [Ignavibacteriaceae bacterium]HMN23849.1 histidine kinase [Ignavibacteriaceae bacterium]HRN28044.1 histidine kinase [Ignavibacteriaceae bacterium]HRP91838.1 histidine kinase [Ignavibacteriaceae bacterium]